MADRNTRLGRRLGEHVAAVGGYSVCVVVGGHPVEGLPRLRVQRHDSTQHDPSARRTSDVESPQKTTLAFAG